MANGMTVLFYISGMLLFGSLNTVMIKIQFSLKSTGIDGEEKYFKFPWLATLNMFVGMGMALVVQRLVRCACSKQRHVAMPDTSPSRLLQRKEGIPYWKKVCLVAIPSFFDLLATALCSVGMLYIPASVWQMLRGCEIVFAAILAVTCLGMKLFGWHLLGLLLCVVGVTFVSLSNIWAGASEPDTGVDQSHLILGMSLVVLGQVVQAAQIIAEEWLLADVDLPEIEIVGYEGMWGLLAMILVVYPILFFVPGDDNGHVEDPRDSFIMMDNNHMVALAVATYTFSCATYNVFGIAITGALSAVHRAILEASRTSVIWVFGLIMHYRFEQPLTPAGFGEKINDYSWLQLLGFVLLLLGQSIYGTILKLPFFTYPAEEVQMEQFKSPGSTKSLLSPLPRQHVVHNEGDFASPELQVEVTAS